MMKGRSGRRRFRRVGTSTGMEIGDYGTLKQIMTHVYCYGETVVVERVVASEDEPTRVDAYICPACTRYKASPCGRSSTLMLKWAHHHQASNTCVMGGKKVSMRCGQEPRYCLDTYVSSLT